MSKNDAPAAASSRREKKRLTNKDEPGTLGSDPRRRRLHHPTKSVKVHRILPIVSVACLGIMYLWLETRLFRLDSEQPKQYQPKQYRSYRTNGNGGTRAEGKIAVSREGINKRKSPRFETSFWCPGCFHSLFYKQREAMFCGDDVEELNGTKTNLISFLKELARRHAHWRDGGYCWQKCVCGNSSSATATIDHKYWYFDVVTPPMIEYSTTYYLPSVPTQSRFPNNVQELASTFNVSAWLEEKWNNGRQFDALVEYNPSVAILPRQIRQALGTRFRENGNHDGSNSIHSPSAPMYVASFRVSSAHRCYPKFGAVNKDQYEMMDHQNYLALVLLDSNLNIIPGSDIGINLEQELGFEAIEILPSNNYFVDYRLFCFDDKLYLNMNDSRNIVYLVPFTLKLPSSRPVSATLKPATTIETEDDHNDDCSQGQPQRRTPLTVQDFYENQNRPIPLSNAFGCGMQVVLDMSPSTLVGMSRGKNYALFQSPFASLETNDHHENGKKVIMAEISLFHPRVLQAIDANRVNFIDQCKMWHVMYPPAMYKKFHNTLICPEETKDRPPRDRLFALHRRQVQNLTGLLLVPEKKDDPAESVDAVPGPSFSAVDELWFPRPVFKMFAHGGACCVAITWSGSEDSPNSKAGEFLVGVGHTKISGSVRWTKLRRYRSRNLDIPSTQYVSFFYAFDPLQPLQIVARTGLFCLPFASDDQDIKINAYHYLTWRDSLRFNNHTFDCPAISFVSGIVDHATDDTKAIISYGINDCTPRMVVVDKRKISRLLFQGMETR